MLAIESQRGRELKLGLSVSSAVRDGSALICDILTEVRMLGPCLKASSITVHTHTHTDARAEPLAKAVAARSLDQTEIDVSLQEDLTITQKLVENR